MALENRLRGPDYNVAINLLKHLGEQSDNEGGVKRFLKQQLPSIDIKITGERLERIYNALINEKCIEKIKGPENKGYLIRITEHGKRYLNLRF